MVWGSDTPQCYTFFCIGLASFVIAWSIVLGSLGHIAGVDGLQILQQFDTVCNHQQKGS